MINYIDNYRVIHERQLDGKCGNSLPPNDYFKHDDVQVIFYVNFSVITVRRNLACVSSEGLIRNFEGQTHCLI